jgi:two-component system, OmpR family, sensor histidine kinase BaeS
MHTNHQPKFRATGQRPGWWPEDEPWPPVRRHWGEGRQWGGRRGRLVRRLGCFFTLAVFTGLIVFSLLVILAADAVGVIKISGSLGWIILLGFVVLVVGTGLFVWAGRGLRRLSLPLGDLIDAADRIAEGDYSQRVAVRGPREIRTLLNTFNHMAERLENTAEQRRNFMADVAHELRTPLTVIQGNLEGMLDGLYPADESHLKTALEETQLLGRLVEDLRILALAEEGALHLRKEPADLAILLNETALGFQSQADLQGVTLKIETEQEAGQLVIDGERMRQVVSNLISNALRYTPTGGTVVISFTLPHAGGENWAIIEIRDTGPGIPAQEIPRIFERFYKGSDSRGMGLGLSIAKTLVEAHGGSITVESREGEGTAFKIRLPQNTP